MRKKLLDQATLELLWRRHRPRPPVPDAELGLRASRRGPYGLPAGRGEGYRTLARWLNARKSNIEGWVPVDYTWVRDRLRWWGRVRGEYLRQRSEKVKAKVREEYALPDGGARGLETTLAYEPDGVRTPDLDLLPVKT